MSLLGQRLDDRSGIAGVGDRGHAHGMTGGETGANCFEERLRRPLRLPGAHQPDPGREIGIGGIPVETRQLEMGVRVDQSGNDERLTKIDDGITAARRFADREHSGAESQRGGNPLGRQHARVDERDRPRPRKHHDVLFRWNKARRPGFTA